MNTDQLPEGKNKETSDSTSQPDPGTMNTTDPQEHMEGPISSLVNKTADSLKSKDSDEKKEEVSNS